MAKPNHEPGDAPVGICAGCKAPCTGVLTDFGYGSYEFGSERGCHEDWHWASPCCEDEVVDPNDEEEDA